MADIKINFLGDSSSFVSSTLEAQKTIESIKGSFVEVNEAGRVAFKPGEEGAKNAGKSFAEFNKGVTSSEKAFRTLNATIKETLNASTFNLTLQGVDFAVTQTAELTAALREAGVEVETLNADFADLSISQLEGLSEGIRGALQNLAPTTEEFKELSKALVLVDKQTEALGEGFSLLDTSAGAVRKNQELFEDLLKTLEPNTKEAEAAAAAFRRFDAQLGVINEAGALVEGSLGQLEAALEELRKQLLALPPGSEAFEQTKRQIEDLEGEIAFATASTSEKIGKFTEFGNGIASAFAVGQIAAKNFGSELSGEQLEQYQAQIFEVIALLDSLKGVTQLASKENLAFFKNFAKNNAVVKGLSGAFGRASKAVTGFGTKAKVAIASTGIGLLIVAVGTLITFWDDITGAIEDSLGPIGEFVGRLLNGLRDVASFLTFGLIQSTADARKAVIEETRKIVEETQGILSEVSARESETRLALLRAQGADEVAIFKATQTEIARLRDERAKASAAAIKEENRLTLEAQSLRERARTAEQAKAAAEKEKELAEQKKLTADLLAEQARATQALAENERKFEEKRAADRARRRKERLEAQKRAAEEELRQRQLIERLQFDLLEEGLAKQLIAVQRRFNEREKIIEENAANAEEKEALLAQARAALFRETTAIFAAEEEKKRKKGEEELKKFESEQKKAQKARLDANAQALKLEETILSTSQEIERQKFFETKRTEEEITEFLKEQEEERTEFSLAQQLKRLEFIKANGEARTDIEERLLTAQINNIKAQIAGLDTDISALSSPESKKELSFWGIFGLDEEAAEAAKVVASTTTAFIEEQLGAAIEQRKEAAEQRLNILDKELADAENALGREIELAKIGKANSVELQRQQIAEIEAQRAEALEAQRKAQKEELILQTATQAANLITSSTNIINSFSSLPFGVGIPLAAVVIGTMFAAFVAAKKRAFDAVKAEKGLTGRVGSDGVIVGNRHTDGGVGLEVEGGEFFTTDGARFGVVNRKMTKKHFDLLAAINKDNRPKMLEYLAQLTASAGPIVNLSSSGEFERSDKILNSVSVNFSSQALEENNRLFKKYLSQKQKAKTSEKEVIYRAGFRIEIRGNKTRRINN